MDPQQVAEQALAALTAAGFDHAQASASVSAQSELNITHDQPSLLRSTEDHSLALLGLIDGRKASATLTDLSPAAIKTAAEELIERAKLAPQDAANAVSDGQTGHFEQGPLAPDLDLLAAKVQELLDFRAAETPLMHLEEGAASHGVDRECLVTTGGTCLTATVGAYGLVAMGTASEGDRSSSFNYTGGSANDLAGAHAAEQFGLGEMLRETERQIDTQPIGGSFEGEIIMAPGAVGDMLYWLMEQLSDFALISDASIYKDSVGEQIASKLLSVHSRFDRPGGAAFTGDGFVAPPLTLLDAGRLTTLLPSFYGSRKTGLPHVPTASGWVIAPGETPRAEIANGISKGAWVNRLSMGSPAGNGDFSGVIKNSFRIDDGAIGPALSETMINGNMAELLKAVSAVSAEVMDTGSEAFPWLRVGGLNFS